MPTIAALRGTGGGSAGAQLGQAIPLSIAAILEAIADAKREKKNDVLRDLQQQIAQSQLDLAPGRAELQRQDIAAGERGYAIEDSLVEFVHFKRIHPHAFAIEPQFDLLSNQLRNTGHGADKNVQFECH